MTQQLKDWKSITKEDLFDLVFRKSTPDSVIASMYRVTKNQVSYKRNKMNLKVYPGSDGFQRLCAEQAIEALVMHCGMSDKYKQRLLNVIKEFYNK